MKRLFRLRAAPTTNWSDETLQTWIAIEGSVSEKRVFLERHSELISQRSVAWIEAALSGHEADEAGPILAKHLRALRDAVARVTAGIDARSAARDASVNHYGGLALDQPQWLEHVTAQLAQIAASTSPGQSAASRVDLLRRALRRLQDEGESQIDPPVAAALRVALWDALSDVTDADEEGRYQEAAAALELSLDAYPADRFPLQRALVLGAIGSVHANRPSRRTSAGDGAISGASGDLERAIELYESALALRPRDQDPVVWGDLQHGLANVYLKRLAGNPDENVERGIACCRAALEVFAEATDPTSWGLVMNTLGSLYQQATAGGRRANIERAIAAYRDALRVFTQARDPDRYAMLQGNLGVAYRNRIAGDPIANAEFAMAAHFEALKVYKKETHPLDYAMTMSRLADVSLDRPALSTTINIESAIRGYREALDVYRRAGQLARCAAVLNNLGLAYVNRPGGRSEDVEQAIAAFGEALQIYTREQYPADHALSLNNLALAYLARRQGNPASNLADALRCYRDALTIYTPQHYPVERRKVLLGLAWAEASRGEWSSVHAAYEAAREIEERLLHEEAGEEARAALIREGRDTAVRDAFALVRLGRVAQAAVAIERGRARGWAEWQLIDGADAERIQDAGRRGRFEAARAQLRAVWRALYAPLEPMLDQNTFLREWEAPEESSEIRQRELEQVRVYALARAAFDAIVAESRAAADPPDLLDQWPDEVTLLRAAEAGGPSHALVYLVATPWGGVALAALGNPAKSHPSDRFAALDLPQMHYDRVAELVQSRLTDETLHVIGGFAHAQAGSALNALLVPLWQGETLRERARYLYDACLGKGKASTLSAAAQRALGVPACQALFDRPVEGLSDDERGVLEGTLNHLWLQEELRASLSKLSQLVMRPLGEWLRARGVESVTLIPCGFLEALPLPAVPVDVSGRTFADLLPCSVAPCARALLHQGENSPPRSGVYALGNPYPTRQDLPWGEAEALSVAKLARIRGLSATVRVQERATREALLSALTSATIVQVSCHGRFHALDFLRSIILLAGGESLSLGEILGEPLELGGLRLFILSACQTALPDVRGQADEVRSLATALLQAGARAVMAALWPVDDQATYLLVVRFAQEWFPRLDQEPPAHALARAQHWVRTATNRQLRAWRSSTLVDPTPAELERAGVTMQRQPLTQVDPNRRGALVSRIAVRGRGDRYTISEAERLQRDFATAAAPDARPYADPIYWAGFEIVGW